MNSKEVLEKYKKLIFIISEILVTESKQDISPEEAMQRIRNTCIKYGVNRDGYEIIKKDLDKLEQLENENQKLKERYNELQFDYNDLQKDYDVLDAECIELEKENQELRLFANKLNNTNFVLCGELADAEKYKQALEKACERLDDDCPVSQELIDDLDCENCNNNCKECWKKFFLKEAEENVED